MEVKDIIGNIEEAYHASELTYEMMVAYFMNLSGITFQTIKIKSGSPVVRARYSDNLTSFSNLKEVSYPSPELVKKFSRLNRPSQSLFYASESEQACLSEMLPFWLDEFKIGDIISVTIGKWIIKDDMKLLIIPDTANLNELNQRIVGQLHPDEIEFWNYISEKFKTSTKQDKRIYEFTSAFGNALWLNTKNQSISAEGFVYSSVQSPEHLNIALCIDSVNNGNVLPVDFVVAHFQKEVSKENDLPKYQEIGERKRGSIDIDQTKIKWI